MSQLQNHLFFPKKKKLLPRSDQRTLIGLRQACQTKVGHLQGISVCHRMWMDLYLAPIKPHEQIWRFTYLRDFLQTHVNYPGTSWGVDPKLGCLDFCWLRM